MKKHNKPSILLVEDDPAIRGMMEQFLRPIADVTAVDDGDAALNAAWASHPDLICLDLGLPQVSGFQVCQSIRADERTQHIPILVVSGRAGVGELAHAREVGATAFLLKPFKGRDLVSRVEELLGIHAPAAAFSSNRKGVEVSRG